MSLTSPVSCILNAFFLSHRLLFYLLYFLSSDESDSLDDESDKLGSDSGSYGTYSFRTFSLHFYNSVGSVSVLGSDVFAPTGFDYKGDIFASNIFLPTGVDPKGCRFLENVGAQIPYFLSKSDHQFYTYSCSHTLPRSLRLL